MIRETEVIFQKQKTLKIVSRGREVSSVIYYMSQNDEKPEICSQDLTTFKLFMTSDEFSGVMGAEAAQQEAEGRVRAEKAGSEYRSRPLKAHRWRHRITSQPLKSLLQRNNFVSESRLNSSISSTSVLIQPFPSQHLRTASDRTKCGELRDCFSPQDLPHVKTADP